ncbi:MAG: ribosomal-processing cysteine protease Prp [Treponema sp.]|nr:ribosomal-processing cysteine protease Prp [Treponema sp.]
MITVDAALDEAGILRSCRAEGHAGAGPRGGDIVCAAVSALMRAALGTLSGRQGITIRGDAPRRGLFWIEADYTPEGKDFLSAAGAFLIEGLTSVSREYPDYCTIHIGNWRK